MNERRRYHRVNIEVPITFRIPPNKKEMAGTILDVSGTGLLFRTQEPIKTRQELLLFLPLPARPRTEMHVIVTRVAQESSPQGIVCWVGVRISDRIKFDELEFVRFYASRLQEFQHED